MDCDCHAQVSMGPQRTAAEKFTGKLEQSRLKEEIHFQGDITKLLHIPHSFWLLQSPGYMVHTVLGSWEVNCTPSSMPTRNQQGFL